MDMYLFVNFPKKNYLGHKMNIYIPVYRMNISVYIVHYTKLIERKKYLVETFKKLGIHNFKFFEEDDREDLTNEQLKKYSYSENSWKSQLLEPRKLVRAEISCAIKHCNIYKYILENNVQNSLILEDDAIINPNFEEYINKILEQLNETNYHACFIDNSMKWTIDNNPFINYKIYPDNYIYKFASGKCACAYILSYEGAKLLHENMIPFSLPLDFMHNSIFQNNNMNIYWSHPSIITHGSQKSQKSPESHESKEDYKSSMINRCGSEYIDYRESIILNPITKSEI